MIFFIAIDLICKLNGILTSFIEKAGVISKKLLKSPFCDYKNP